jgi:hypothetical protein
MAILRVSYARAHALDWHPHVHVRNGTDPSPILPSRRIFAKTGHPTTRRNSELLGNLPANW